MKNKQGKQVENDFIDLYSLLTPDVANQVYQLMSAMVKKNEETDLTDPELRMYSLTDLEPIFSVTHRTLLNWVKSGYLPVVKIGGKWRISEKDLMTFIQDKRLKDM